MKTYLILFLLPYLAKINCDNEAERRFQEFHDNYEREMTKSKNSQNRRDSPLPYAENLEKRLVPYTDGNETYQGYAAYDRGTNSVRPAVLIVHDWNGRDEFENGKAEALAKLGYVGFAVDLYGKIGATPEENQALMKPFRENRPWLLKRLQLAIDEVKKIVVVDQGKIGAIGFCFGGLGILDMARAGWDLKGVVAFHGSLNPPPQQSDAPIKAKILIQHGHDDPGIPPSTVEAFETEMTKRKADWQVHVYSNTVHGFTVPTANSTSYNALSDKRSWLAMKDFFEEVFV